MSSPFDEPRLSPWEEEGRRHAATVDDCAFVLILGDRPESAAELALGMGQRQARRRRVAVADAVGELGPIEDLAPMDAPYGMVDVCVHGVSLAQVAHAVDASGNLNVLPSGPIPLDRAAILRSPRWERIATEFREAGALLLLVAPADEPALDAVLPLVDGVILVGRAQPLPGARVLLYVRGPGSGGHPVPRPTPFAYLTPSSTPRVPPPRPPAARLTTARPEMPVSRRTWPWWLAAGALVVITGGGIARAALTRRTTVAAGGANAPAERGATTDSAAPADSGSASAVDAARGAAAAAADSEARSPAYAVELGTVTSVTGANARLDDDMLRVLPALTYAPVVEGSGDKRFRLLAGAYRERTPADSLLATLRRRKVLGIGEGFVVRVPFAVVVQSAVTRDQASFYASGLRAKGWPVYALVQDDGLVRFYAGAFERAADADLLVAMMIANGERPIVTYRTGRLP